ncbi:YfiR family protein [Thiolapillus brandeum]|nr:YfiR family protein [Thiolapillus brandeum]
MNRLTYTRVWRHSCFVLLVLSLLLPAELLSAGAVSPEYKLKAALIYKLTKFVEWPRNSRERKQFGICILGRDDFGSALNALEARQVGNQPIHIQRFAQSEAVNSSCQILFISESKRPFLKTILHSLAPLPILTIGDMGEFAEMGGMIELTRGHKRIGFRINLQQADRAGLKIAAPLLDLATIVETIQP